VDCPRCNTALTEGKYENEQAMLCPSCSGVLIKQRSLPKVLNKFTTDLYASIGPDFIVPTLPDKGAATQCPDCHSKMDYYGYMGSNKIMIDCCTSCYWLWVDTMEFSAMAKMYIQTEKSVERTRSSYKPADIVSMQMITRAIERAFLMGFVIS
jgi:Zn-finger nucleic acid-binding protein